MICNSTYDSYEAIPEAFRSEFEQKNGKWSLKEDAIPGAGALFNPGLAANEQRAVGQVKQRNERIAELEGQLATANAEVSGLKQPGSVILSSTDGKAWDRYNKLGSPADLEKIVGEHKDLKVKVAQTETAQNIEKVVSDTGLNHEVLSDWVNSVPDGDKLEFFVKETKGQDDKGKEVIIKTPFVKVETKAADGRVEVSEKELLPFAKEAMPSWKYDALVTVKSDDGSVKTVIGQSQVNQGVKMPALSSARAPVSEGDKAGERPVDKFNAQRGSAVNPFMPSSQAAQK